ncbi:helix-turn-helix domain-containing protein [Streptomyces polyrhachis]|uniref:Helix-turn-helix domain-containing protein n=1 Tax=Streptomyces polyrhachis TaxID=1282885 RepID=A0ABW2GBS7_9ACTN
MSEVGSAVRALRLRAGVTQDRLAERSGVSVRTIRRLENGDLPDHRLGTLTLIAAALGTTAAELGAGDAPGSAAVPAAPDVPAPFRLHGPLPEAVDALAREVRRHWRREEEHRRVRDPFTLPVRWRPLSGALVDQTANILRLAPGEPARELDLDGDLTRVAELYRRIPSGRLVVLGRPGSGKSILAIRLVLDCLETPEADGGRLPVLLDLASWTPTTSLRDWLVRQLADNHPYLARHDATGTSLAALLVDSDALLPVLDGFDELARELRAEALRELNATSTPLVLTSRAPEFAEAVREVGAPLLWAAGVELSALSTDDLAHYLPRTLRHAPAATPAEHPPATGWDSVLAHLADPHSRAGARLAEVLGTPLMTSLARTVYEGPGPDPAELVELAAHLSTVELEERLLAAYVPAVYRPRTPEPAAGHRPTPRASRPAPDAAHAQRWLGYLADHLVRTGRHDLAWWRIGHALPRRSRALVLGAVAAVCVTAATVLVNLLLSPFSPQEFALAPAEVALHGALTGLVGGTGLCAVYAFGDRAAPEPARARLRLPRGRPRLPYGRGRLPYGRSLRPRMHSQRRAPVRRLAALALGGAVLGTGLAAVLPLQLWLFADPLAAAPDPAILARGFLADTLFFTAIFSLSGIGVLGLVSALEVALDTATAATPAGLLADERARVLRLCLLVVPALTLTIALTGRLLADGLDGLLGPLAWSLPAGLAIGTIGGLAGTGAHVLGFTAWGQWVLLVRLWLPLTGRLPWDTAAFLDDAHRRGVLRRHGALYQFRHLRLRDHLARDHRERREDQGSRQRR